MGKFKVFMQTNDYFPRKSLGTGYVLQKIISLMSRWQTISKF